ncbi:hypothetical protein FOZ62_016809, partial [Perkinsus olseni]
VECDEDETVGNLTDRLLERLGLVPSETSILTTPSERRILMAVGDSRHWSGDDRCGDVLGEDAGCDNECFDRAKTAGPSSLFIRRDFDTGRSSVAALVDSERMVR